ncbi:MAG TPA: glycosyltransferase family 1 protein [Thermoleophilaceae bacterium]|nr:glycosyltransferase family 1 protein [Thermoleophilaceae bacterium]
MVIGVDARAAAEVPAGRGRVVRELLEALARLPGEHSFALFCRRPAEELELDGRFRWHAIDAPDPLWHLRAALAANRSCAVFLSTNSYLTVWFLRVPCAIVVHDLIAFRPGTHPQRRAALIERATIRPALRRAAALLCVSDATRSDLVELFPRAASKASVAPLAVSERLRRPRSDEEVAAVRRRHGLDGPYVLFTGTLEPRKNLVRLVEAFAGLPEELRAAHTLALVGPRGWEADEIQRRVGAAGGQVRVLGFVPDDELAALYQACTLFCYPSLYEGFGLPVLEAMTCGAPVLTSRVSSLPEVGGNGAAYVDPLDVADMRDGIARLLGSSAERRALAERGRARAAEFSWERTAREVLGALERVARAA